ncbi:MAG: hypothetical protein QM598_12495 [Protaetiibacter sp.]
MKIKKSLNLLGAGAAVAVVAALVAAPISAMAAPDAPTTTTHPIWLSSGSTTPVLLAPTATPKLNASVYAAKSSNPADRLWAMPSGAVKEYEFISARGSEFNVDTWSTYSDPHNDPGTEVNLKVSNFPTANPGKSFDTIGNVGGDFSLGLAFVNASGAVIEANFAHITITPAGDGNPVNATYTFSTPAAAATAPAITTQPANASVSAGATATFTAAASGSPAPTVQWQSSSDGTTWTDVNGATNATLTVAGATVAQSGTKYHAVFTNSAGSATTDAATLAVSPLFPTQPTGSDAHKVTIAAPVAGDATITVPAGAANANKTLQVWAWSDPTNLGQEVADADGDVVVDITSLPAGEHTVAFTEPGDATLTVVAWGTFEKLSASGDPLTDDVDLKATVTASDLWSLNAEETQVDFGNVTRGATKTASLGKVTVVDDRNVLKGWDLGVGWTKFTKGADEIPASALTVAGKLYAGYTPVAGIEVGTGTNLAKSTAVSTSPAGALFDADLAFTAPVTAQAGEYHSTLTLTLTSR